LARSRAVSRGDLTRLRHELTGHKIVPSNNPTTFIQLPWNNWTFERESAVTAEGSFDEITVQDILDQIVNRIGIKDTDPKPLPRIKVQYAAAWLTAAGLIYPDMETSFYELAGQDLTSVQYPRSTQRDKGTLNMPAKTAFEYSLADKREILGAEQGALKVIKATSLAGEGAKLTVRVRVVWNCTPV